MSVRTTADEKRDEAIDHVTEAIKSLSEIIIGRCWGHDGYTQIYYNKMRKALADLIEMRDGLT